MADNELPINYDSVLADLRAKREKLDAAIAGIELMLGLSSPSAATSPNTPIQAQEVESDSFFGMSIPDAARKFLGMRKKPQTTQEIADALDRGGLTHQSGDFSNTVGSVLNRIEKANGDVVKLGRAKWGLAAWYPGTKRKRPNGGKALQDLTENDEDAEGPDESQS